MSTRDLLQQQYDREIARIEGLLDETLDVLAELKGRSAADLIRDPQAFYRLTKTASASWRSMIEVEALLGIRRLPRR